MFITVFYSLEKRFLLLRDYRRIMDDKRGNPKERLDAGNFEKQHLAEGNDVWRQPVDEHGLNNVQKTTK